MSNATVSLGAHIRDSFYVLAQVAFVLFGAVIVPVVLYVILSIVEYLRPRWQHVVWQYVCLTSLSHMFVFRLN